MSEELLPCPFTGRKPKIQKAKKKYCQMHGDPLHQDTIICSDRASVQAHTREEAIKAWNTRADNTTLIEKLEGMKRDYVYTVYDTVYNQAIQDAIDLIKEQKNENSKDCNRYKREWRP